LATRWWFLGGVRQGAGGPACHGAAGDPEQEATLEQELSRQYHILKAISDPRVLGAVLHAPPFLSGLNDAEHSLVKSRAKQAAHPEQVNGIERMTKGLDELRNGVSAAERAILARTKARIDGDGQVRSISEPSQGKTLPVAKSAVA
jgi:hypothetical protein